MSCKLKFSSYGEQMKLDSENLRLDEVENGLYYFRTSLFRAIPRYTEI